MILDATLKQVDYLRDRWFWLLEQRLMAIQNLQPQGCDCYPMR